MFTGIIEGTGTVTEISPDTGSRSAIRMVVDLGACSEGLKIGDSVAINGVCLTATSLQETLCTFEMIQETVRMTGLGDLKPGGTVNIERSLRAGDRLEGHFVLGHVDGTGVISSIREDPGEVRVCVTIPESLAAQVVRKGSIAVDGISLTITGAAGDEVCFSLIPHTIQVTNFRSKRVGDRVNIETDILGKYALKRNLPE